MRWLRFRLIVLILSLLVLGVGSGAAARQLDPTLREQVTAAAVRVAVPVVWSEDGVESVVPLPIGSGTIVSPDGVVLTNSHVVDETSLNEHLALLEADLTKERRSVTLRRSGQDFILLGSDGASPPKPVYVATLAAEDRERDVAALRITAFADPERQGEPVAPTPFVPFGDSDEVTLGEGVQLFAYPAIGGDSLTYTTGVVSGFGFDEDSGEREWISTDAVMSGGSSGGTAINDEGTLIGIPTAGSELDCRAGDTNRDGTINESDVGCIPVGGSLGMLVPVNDVVALLVRSGLVVRATGDRSGEAEANARAQELYYAPGPELVQRMEELDGYYAIVEHVDGSGDPMTAEQAGNMIRKVRTAIIGGRAEFERTVGDRTYSADEINALDAEARRQLADDWVSEYGYFWAKAWHLIDAYYAASDAYLNEHPDIVGAVMINDIAGQYPGGTDLWIADTRKINPAYNEFMRQVEQSPDYPPGSDAWRRVATSHDAALAIEGRGDSMDDVYPETTGRIAGMPAGVESLDAYAQHLRAERAAVRAARAAEEQEQTADPNNGYVSMAPITRDASEASSTGQAVTPISSMGAVNARGGPGLDQPIVAIVNNGDPVTVIGQATDPTGLVWIQVQLADGTTAYIADYLLAPAP